jgi:hypothetical protein|tara:strand:+ start:71 stop:541 length:471 start_codon:yes stop_codon:yes gene_type:complete
MNENNNNNIFSSLLDRGGGENFINKSNRAQQNRGALGNITNNINNNNNSSRHKNSTSNFATTTTKKTSNKNSIQIQILQRDVERLARLECHEFESIAERNSTNSNAEDRIILGKIMEELIVEYSEREQPHSYYYKTLREASSRASSERDDICRFNF